MKKLHSRYLSLGKTAFRTPALFAAVTALAAAFWFFTGTTGLATPNQCTFCHKRTTTMTLACTSLEYQRHLDHGDTVGSCAASRSSEDPQSAKRAE